MRWVIAVAVLACLPLGAGKAGDVAREIRETGFDSEQCYRIRELNIIHEDLKIYLSDGHLIFSKPIAGRRVAAAFVGDVEGGDGEVILLPPTRAERSSLAAATATPNLDEHFGMAFFVFTGADYDNLLAQLPGNPANKRDPEAGARLADTFTPTLRSVIPSFQTRLALDLFGGPAARSGLFAALLQGRKLGNFDIIFDPFGEEQIVAGQANARDDRTYFDIWTSFQVRSYRQRPAPRRDDVTVSDYRIEATVNPDLTLDAVTQFKVKPLVDGMTAVTFEMAPQMTVTAASVEGRAADVLQRESLRVNITRAGNDLFLVFPPEPLRAGHEYEFEIRHSGKVIVDAGDRVYFVAARGNWYPMHNLQFANYDLLFRYPQNLDLVTAGDVVADHADGEWRVTLRRTPAPIRFAAFNLGNYEHARIERNGFVVDVCANRTLERALQPKDQIVVTLPSRGGRPNEMPQIIAPPARDPLEKLQTLAADVASSLDFMVSRFGPPALPHISVTPIPGTFGQGFPGLIYISTLAYLKSLPGRGSMPQTQELYFEDLLQAHEVAHQWWGNRVTSTSYRDNWIMEALANTSALMYIEKRKGLASVELMLDSYRGYLLEKGAGGQTVESTGPIVFGPRLENSQAPSAYRTITYGKGTWILQMLRRRMGDERFEAMLKEILKRYDHRDFTTAEFRVLAAQFLPPRSDDAKLESFFDQWVEGTGIPMLKLTYSVKGKVPDLRLTGTVTQSEVDDEFTTLVPVEIQTAKGTITQWVKTSNDPVTFSLPLTQAPLKVALDPHYAVLRRQ